MPADSASASKAVMNPGFMISSLVTVGAQVVATIKRFAWKT
jgi:hypothetical protein